MKRTLLTILMLTILPLASMAQLRGEEQGALKAYIPVGEATIDESHKGDEALLSEFAEEIKYEDKNYPIEMHQEATLAPKPVVEPASESMTEPEQSSPFYMSVQTNMLYLLAAVPNIGIEFYLGKNWSIDTNWHYSWWKSDPKSWYWRTYGGDIAVRKWFGKSAKEKPLTGHHAGIYGQMLTYDVEFGGKGYLADRWNWAAGVEYGYSLPIAKRLNIDFTLGVGYHWGTYDKYLPIDGHYVWQSTNKRRYIGPTKVEVSLVWLIGNNNVNAKKGGKR